MAEEFNNYFMNKVKTLQAAAMSQEEGDPIGTLKNMLESVSRPEDVQLRRLTRKDLRGLMRAVKPGSQELWG